MHAPLQVASCGDQLVQFLFDVYPHLRIQELSSASFSLQKIITQQTVK
jgi:hypothetical protein